MTCIATCAVKPRLEKLDVHAIRYFTTAAPTLRFEHAAMRRTHAQLFELMHDTMVAMSETATTVTKHIAIALPSDRIHQGGSEHLYRQPEALLQPDHIHYSSPRNDPLIRIDVQPHEPGYNYARQGVGRLELPQDRDQ
jgi:hypothetical protein